MSDNNNSLLESLSLTQSYLFKKLKVKERNRSLKKSKIGGLNEAVRIVKKYLSFVGPGLMVSVAYMDPGNYSTSVAAGASNRYSLLFVVLLSNIIAIFYQSLCVKLGTVTGLDLSRSCKKHLPSWLNYLIYLLAECAIIATDIAEVIGSAIALNILLKVPLAAGVCITIVDVLLVMMAYRPGSGIKFIKLFEMLVAVLVFVVVICFCVQLGMLPKSSTPVGGVFRGYVPSSEMIKGNGIYIAVSVIGATVMPHSLFLGSALVQPRLREYDLKVNNRFDEDITRNANAGDRNTEAEKIEDKATKLDENYYNYEPSFKAIRYAYKYSVAEVGITLFTFALFVNSSILIVAGSLLYGSKAAINADLYSIHDLLSSSVAPVIGTIFMCALLASGQSAGIVCTMAGQIICEGHLNWKIKPWLRRIITRLISILPCLVVAVCIGKSGLSKALNASQVVLSILLPLLVAPLIYFTSNSTIMKVELTHDEHLKELKDAENKNYFKTAYERVDKFIDYYFHIMISKFKKKYETSEPESRDDSEKKYYKDMSNNWIITIFCLLFWILISIMNVYAIYAAARDGI